jgi:hypothetical protein
MMASQLHNNQETELSTTPPVAVVVVLINIKAILSMSILWSHQQKGK